jgi:hypothetical protein
MATAAHKAKAVHAIRAEYADYLTRLGRYQEALAAYNMLLAEAPSHAKQLQPIVHQLESHLDAASLNSVTHHE